MNLRIEHNAKALVDPTPAISAKFGIRIPPPISKDFWLMRVPVSEKQAIVVFPKFGMYGVAFQNEITWNVNCPTLAPAATILAHIARNKGDDSIPDERCLLAIYMLQEAVRDLQLSAAVQAVRAEKEANARIRMALAYIDQMGGASLLEALVEACAP